MTSVQLIWNENGIYLISSRLYITWSPDHYFILYNLVTYFIIIKHCWLPIYLFICQRFIDVNINTTVEVDTDRWAIIGVFHKLTTTLAVIWICYCLCSTGVFSDMFLLYYIEQSAQLLLLLIIHDVNSLNRENSTWPPRKHCNENARWYSLI